jgi:polyphosphate kinase 2 (PPK2 family)
MLELVDLSKKLSKEIYQETFPELEARLGACQRAALEAGVPVIVVFEGWDAAGKGSLINRMSQALDPRGFTVHAISAPNEVERYYPWMWRYRSIVPADGKVAIFDRSWYGRVLVERIEDKLSKRQWEQAYEDIQQFERQLADAGRVIVKFWLHIDKKEQKKRFKKIGKDPVLAWKVGKQEWRHHRKYDTWLSAVEEMLQRTSAAHAPWTVVEATNARFARVKVFETVIEAIEQELERRASAPKIKPQPMPKPEPSPTRQHTILDRVDTSLSIEREEYNEELDKLQKRIFQLEHEIYVARVPAVIVYEGWDAAGKGGNIKRLTRGLDPRGYEVVPVAAPTRLEKSHHYLWRFWNKVPKAGHITIFDRSWYGRVMVERVEGFCHEQEWRRAFREINEFERQLADFGTAIIKFWLHIDPEEQLRRFEARQDTPEKQWKITDEDWRNREKYEQYRVAVVEMLQRTSTTYAPWTILEANCKLHARIKALRTVAKSLEDALEHA